MKAYVRFIPVFLMLFFFVQVGAPPTSDNEKKIGTRSDPGSAGDPDQAKEKEQNKDVDKQDTADKDSKEESLENKEQTGVPSPPSTKLPVSPSPTAADNNCTGTNNTKECEEEGVKPSLKQILTSMVTENKGMLTRTLYVLIGVTLIVVVYYVMRAIRLRKKSKTKKYGVISSRDADLEMRPLEEEDDEEDVTVFEVNGMTDFRSTAHR